MQRSTNTGSTVHCRVAANRPRLLRHRASDFLGERKGDRSQARALVETGAVFEPRRREYRYSERDDRIYISSAANDGSSRTSTTDMSGSEEGGGLKAASLRLCAG